MKHLAALVPNLNYDVCVLTGDFRGATYGPFKPALNGLAKIRARIKGPVFGVLGNHDTIRMVPALEEMGVRMLLNECEPLERAGARVYLAGIDDANFYRLDNIEKAAGGHTSGRILNPAVAHSGNLPPGRTRGLRSATRRPHPWWADLFAGLDPNYAQSAGPSASLGIGVVESRAHGGLHLGRCWLRPCAGTPQLPA
jgi:Calcineurin-like phosphoesterase